MTKVVPNEPPHGGRVPPHDLKAEESLLGAMLLSRDAIGAGLDGCTAEDFYKPAHGHVFAAIQSLYAKGEPVDAVTVADELRHDGLLEVIGGPSELVSLQAGTPATSNAATYARIVADHRRLARMISAAGEIAELGYSVPADVGATIDKAEQLLFAVADQRTESRVVSITEAMRDFLDRLEARYDAGGVTGVSSGLFDLDEMLTGFRPGQLVILAGRPGMGKSALAASIAAHVAREATALLVSLEMSIEEIEDRYMATASQLNLQSIRTGKVGENDWPRLSAGVERLAKLSLHIEDNSMASLTSIRSTIRRVVAKAGGLGLVVVDYLQLLGATHRSENRQVEVAEFSRGLKKMALELKVPVLALAQLNRGLEARSDKRPMLSDLRESGAIENDADVVVFIYRDDYYKPDQPPTNIAELIVAKQRNGPTGKAGVFYDPSTGQFRNLTRSVV